MVHFSNYLVKTHAHVVGRWSLWEKLAKAKRAVKNAYIKATGRTSLEAQAGENFPTAKLPSDVIKPTAFQQLLRGYSFVNKQGFARIQQQLYTRPGSWGRGAGLFGKDFLWRRLRTGHLLGFATLFLVHEERVEAEIACRKRTEAYRKICENIKDVFAAEIENDSDVPDSSLSKHIADYGSWKGIAAGSNGSVFEAETTNLTPRVRSATKMSRPKDVKTSNGKKLGPKNKQKRKVAVKMIYNFNSSNAGVIYQQTSAELVTCGRGALAGLSKNWQNGSRARMKSHPNIVKLLQVIIDKVPNDTEFAKMSPALLPEPVGYGRSTAMFLVMKRYDGTLADYLNKCNPSFTTRTIMALQLLNGVAHLERSKVAHRDLKSNNILVENDATDLPRLVIADFGCTLVPGPNESLSVPFLSSMHDIRNGNGEIQPPEISNCRPGPTSVLDYGKADAWAVGLLLCEIMGFDRNEVGASIAEDGRVIAGLIKKMLRKNVKERMTCTEAGRILHLELFGPKFLEEEGVKGSEVEEVIKNWLALHASETLAYRNTNWGKNSVVCELFTHFLSNADWMDLCSGFSVWSSLNGCK